MIRAQKQRSLSFGLKLAAYFKGLLHMIFGVVTLFIGAIWIIVFEAAQGPVPEFFQYGGLIMLLVSLWLFYIAKRKGDKLIALLEYGEVGHAEFISKENTNMKINEQRVYRLTFELEVYRKKYMIQAKTQYVGQFQKGKSYQVIYELENPENAYPVVLMPPGLSKLINIK